MNENIKKKNLRGVMSANTNKNKATQPDLRGICHIDGKDYQISTWENISADNKKYYSLIFKEIIITEVTEEKKSDKKEDWEDLNDFLNSTNN